MNEIIIYTDPNNDVQLEVKLEEDTVWLTQAQMVGLFQSSKANISEHVKNIFQSNELEEKATVRKFRTVRKEGKRTVRRRIYLYNLDVIISQNKPRNLNNINHYNRSISSRASDESDGHDFTSVNYTIIPMQ